MTDIHLTLFCLVDGEAASNAFSVNIVPSKTIGDLKDLIKTEKTPRFDKVAADELTLWRVSIPDDDDEDEDEDEDKNLPILLDNISHKDKKKLKATRELSDVFIEKPAKRMIHIVVQLLSPRPSGNNDVVCLAHHLNRCERNVLILLFPVFGALDDLHPEIAALRKQLSAMVDPFISM